MSNALFLWPCSIAIFNYQRVSYESIIIISKDSWQFHWWPINSRYGSISSIPLYHHITWTIPFYPYELWWFRYLSASRHFWYFSSCNCQMGSPWISHTPSMAIAGSDLLELPTIKAYSLGLCQKISPQNIAKNMVTFTYQPIYCILKFPRSHGTPVFWAPTSHRFAESPNLITFPAMGSTWYVDPRAIAAAFLRGSQGRSGHGKFGTAFRRTDLMKDRQIEKEPVPSGKLIDN